jgi:hypothetical protein
MLNISLKRLPIKFVFQIIRFFVSFSRTLWVENRAVLPFLAHLAKGHVSFCHHLASIVVRLSVVHRKL